MSGFGNEGEGVSAESGNQGKDNVGNGGDEGKTQHSLHGRGAGAMNMHTDSVYWTGAEAWDLPRFGMGRVGTESAVVRRPLQFSATTMLFSGR